MLWRCDACVVLSACGAMRLVCGERLERLEAVWRRLKQ